MNMHTHPSYATIALAVALVGAGTASANAQTVLFGGDYVTGNVTNVRVVEGSGSPNFQIAAGGGTGSLAFDTSTAMNGTTGYTGPAFYGGLRFNNTGTSAIRVTPSAIQRVANSGTADGIQFGLLGDGQTASDTLVGTWAAAVVLALPEAYNLSSLSVAFTIQDNSVSDVVRLLVGDGTNWYVSNTTRNTTGTLSPNLATETWSTFNPGSLTVSTASLATPDTLTYAGFFLEASYNRTGNVTAGSPFERYLFTNVTFDGTPIPESSAFAALAGLGALSFVAMRRRHRAID